MKPLVSILIPAYNSSETISEAIRSAIEQTWPRKEIIVVDDGSRDRTLPITKGFASQKVRVITQANQGAAAARNKAYSLCQGDFIQWLDADDVLASDKIEKQMEAQRLCESRRTLLSCQWGRFFQNTDRAKFIPTALWCDLHPLEWMLRKMKQNIYMQTTAWLVSRELTEAAGLWDTRLLADDDGEYFTRVILSSDNVCFVPEAKTFYRDSGPESLSRIGRSKQKMEAQLLSMELTISHLRSAEDSERVRSACLTYLQMCLNYIGLEDPDLIKRALALAASLGGRINPPAFSWKQILFKALFCGKATASAKFHYSKLKDSIQSIRTIQ